MSTDLQIDVHLDPSDVARALRDDVRHGLTRSPKALPPKWFYDDRGSELFERITRLPGYYPTRREAEILGARAATIAGLSGADTLVELGSGTSEKTLVLLDALAHDGRLRRFVPFDVSAATLEAAAARIDRRYPGVVVHAVVGDFDRHLGQLPTGGRRLLAFLGGTIGNLEPADRRRFLGEVAGVLGPGEHLLLGTDLVKDEARLVAAYDDPAGVTAAFNRNVLSVINRALGADFAPDTFAHEAVWNAADERIEMWLRSERDQTVTVRELGLQVDFAEHERMCTELSCKFTPAGVEAELAAAGFVTEGQWTDAGGDYALTLARRR